MTQTKPGILVLNVLAQYLAKTFLRQIEVTIAKRFLGPISCLFVANSRGGRGRGKTQRKDKGGHKSDRQILGKPRKAKTLHENILEVELLS